MSFNRVCNCICDDPDDGGGGGALCQAPHGECPDVFGLDVVVPATKCHYGKIASTNCCGFDASSWSHSLSMTSYSNCGSPCYWFGNLQTPHCISATDCGFPFNSMTPDVSCYDSPAGIFKGCDHPTPAQSNGTMQCEDAVHGDVGICQCNVGNGACVTSGIGTIYRNSIYTLHSHGRTSTTCFRCGCNTGCGNAQSGCPNDPPCDYCLCCPSVYPGCSDATTDGQVLYAGGLTTRLHASMRYGDDIWGGGYGDRFYLTVHVAGLIYYAGQFTNCLGEWQQMLSNHANCTNFCCTENPSDSCPLWTSNVSGGTNRICGYESNCGGGFEDIDVGDVLKKRTYQTWGLPPDITPENCLDLRGVTESTAGVVIARDYDSVNLGDCISEALDGDTVGRFGYFGYAKEFSPSWTVT